MAAVATPAPRESSVQAVGAAVVFGVVPCALLVFALVGSIHHHYAFDFHPVWDAARAFLHGRSPYTDSAGYDRLGHHTLDPFTTQRLFGFVYPAPVAALLAPFGLLPYGVAATIFLVLAVAAVALALRLLGVTDWRCYGVAFASMPVLGAIRLGTLTPLLLLALALAWRERDRPLRVGAALGLAIVAKVFLWPLALWLLATRRWRAAGATGVVAVVVTLVSWAVIGFRGLGAYPHLLRALAGTQERKGYSLVALEHALGIGSGSWIVALGVVAASILVYLTARHDDGDRRSFTVALAATVFLTPIVWLHYFALLFVPIALWRRRLAPIWLLPLAFWIWPFEETGGVSWRIVLGLAVFAIGVSACTFGTDRRKLVT